MRQVCDSASETWWREKKGREGFLMDMSMKWGWGEKGGRDFQGAQPRDGEIMEVKGTVRVKVWCEQSMDKDKGVVIERALVTSLRAAGGVKGATFSLGGSETEE